MKLITRIASLCLCLSVLVSVPVMAADNDAKDEDYYKLLKTFAETFEQIDKNYVKDIDRKELMEAAIAGMLQKLDRYSNYIPPEQLGAFNEELQQKFGGIGIQVDIDKTTGRLLVISPLPGTPAFRGGVKAGDLIMEIEGVSTEGITIHDAQKLLRGDPGDPVSIGVLHKGEEEITTIPLVREVIQQQTVLGDRFNEDGTWNYMLDDKQKIGYIRLTVFSEHSADELRAALAGLKEQGAKALILDLRFDPGGLLEQAVEIADLFLKEGTIVSTKGRDDRPEDSESRSAHNDHSYSEEIPMVVLINRFSASASEILSACLQDHKRAIIIGERSWGKGSVQRVIPLAGDTSALKLTTASYHRPSGKNIHKFPGAKDEDEWGVMPDEKFRYQMKQQEIKDYFENRRAKDKDAASGSESVKKDYVDPHLKMALDYLTGFLEGKQEKSDQDKPDSNKTEKPEETGKEQEKVKTE